MSNKQRVLGIGGVFFRARNPESLAAWYHEHLGIPVELKTTFATIQEAHSTVVWATFPADTQYFGSGASPFMLNYRVADLDAMREQLRQAGAAVDDRTERYDNGRFGWATDPEGNRFELWQPAE